MKESLAILLDWVQVEAESNEREKERRIEEWKTNPFGQAEFKVGEITEAVVQYTRMGEVLKTIENLIYNVIEEEKNEK